MAIKSKLTGGKDPVHPKPYTLSSAPAPKEPALFEKEGPGWTKQWGRSV